MAKKKFPKIKLARKPRKKVPKINLSKKPKKRKIPKIDLSKKKVKKRDKVVSLFGKYGKKPPVRYRRPVPKGMAKVSVMLKYRKLKTGHILEFKYGRKQKPGQVGGWKNDPRPVLLIFWDDKIKYVEGINTNYLSDFYLKKVRTIMVRFPGVDGEQLYNIFKRTARFAIEKGYRKYIRASFRDSYLYVYEDDLAKELDDLAKLKQSKFGVADRAKNTEL